MQILSDNTVDTATTALTAHVPQIGGSWVQNTIVAGLFVISNANRIRSSSSPALAVVSNLPAHADHSIACDYYVASIAANTVITGITLRADGAADTEYLAGYNGSGLLWVIHKFVAGTRTILATSSATLTAGNTYALLFTIVGSNLTLYVAGVSTVTATDSTITAAGHVGLRGGATYTDTTGYHVTNLDARDPIYPDVWGMQSQVGHPASPRHEIVGY